MGIYSTLLVTRSKAIETVTAMLEQELTRLREGCVSDEELATRLDQYLEPQLNNASVVSDDHERNDDDRVPYPTQN